MILGFYIDIYNNWLPDGKPAHGVYSASYGGPPAKDAKVRKRFKVEVPLDEEALGIDAPPIEASEVVEKPKQKDVAAATAKAKRDA